MPKSYLNLNMDEKSLKCSQKKGNLNINEDGLCGEIFSLITQERIKF